MSNSTNRYKNNPEYRARVLKLNREYRIRNKQYPVFLKLCRIRNVVQNCKTSIALYKEKIKIAQNKIYKANRRKEELELEWGALRARLKRDGKYYPSESKKLET